MSTYLVCQSAVALLFVPMSVHRRSIETGQTRSNRVGGNVEFPFKVPPTSTHHTLVVLNLEPLWIDALQCNIIQQFE